MARRRAPAEPAATAAPVAAGPSGPEHVVLHVQLPDRPGALGAVASRIGAVGADITDVVVARRDAGRATDVFHMTLPPARVDVMALLCEELREVDGARIEWWATATCCVNQPDGR